MKPPIDDRLMIRPERCARSVGRTARSTLSVPNTLVSNTARAAASVASSTAASRPRPALFTTMSMRPNCCTADSTAAAAADSSSTSSATPSSRSPPSGKRAAIACGSRAVATTEWPAASAFSTISAPKPRDAPVMNHTLIYLPSGQWIRRGGHTGAPSSGKGCGRYRVAHRWLRVPVASARPAPPDRWPPSLRRSNRKPVRQLRIRQEKPPRLPSQSRSNGSVRVDVQRGRVRDRLTGDATQFSLGFVVGLKSQQRLARGHRARWYG